MYFTKGKQRAFELLMQQKPGFDRYQSGCAGDDEDCGTCRFYRPGWKYEFCVFKECPYDWMKITADAAYNLFSWNSKCAATPFEISRMPAPAIRALFTACFIANGDCMVSVRENDKGEKEFEIDDSAGKRREAFNLQMEQMMEAPGMEPD